MSLDSRPIDCIPHGLAELIAENLRTPPLPAQRNMPLFEAPVDHIAIAVESRDEVERLQESMAGSGAVLREPLLLWPDEIPECPIVPAEHKKWMATLDVGPFWVVLLAPHRDDDLIAGLIARCRGPAVHHIAFCVDDIKGALARVLQIPCVRQVSVLAEDTHLSQVFLGHDDDHRIVELIERDREFTGTFTCRNTAALTTGEALYRKSG